MRRILSVVFSDYYHFDNGDGTYKETRTINDDFGKDLFCSEYTEEEYNADINFCIDCLKFYLTMQRKKIMLYAPQEDVKKRLNMAKMSEIFRDWAEVYFAPDGDNLNCLIKKQNAWHDFLQDTGANESQWKVNRFMIALRAFAQNNELTINPETLTGYCVESKRIIRFRGGKSYEYFYLQTEGEPLHNDRFNDEFC